MKANNKLRIFSISLLFILGILALYGGLSFISDPSGKSIQISIDVLDGTPFNDFLIPGIILILANGFLSLLIAVLTIKRTKHYQWFIILQGCILIGWLTAELIFNIEMFLPIMHYPLYTVGILFILIGFIINKRIHQKKDICL